MVIYIGADHRGFQMKEQLKAFLSENGWSVSDAGAKELVPDDDYVDYAQAVAEKVSMNPTGSRGILVCGNGVGMDIVANKFNQVRSVLGISPDHVLTSREKDDTNVLSLGADFIDMETAKKMVSILLQTPFSEAERHKRRLEKIRQIDNSLN